MKAPRSAAACLAAGSGGFEKPPNPSLREHPHFNRTRYFVQQAGAVSHAGALGFVGEHPQISRQFCRVDLSGQGDRQAADGIRECLQGVVGERLLHGGSFPFLSVVMTPSHFLMSSAPACSTMTSTSSDRCSFSPWAGGPGGSLSAVLGSSLQRFDLSRRIAGMRVSSNGNPAEGLPV